MSLLAAALLSPSPASAQTPATSRRTRIRFAPLPDPRRAVLVTDEGAELPLPHPDFNFDYFSDVKKHRPHDDLGGELNPLTPASIPAAVSIAALSSSPLSSPRILVTDLAPQSTPPKLPFKSLPAHLDITGSSTSSSNSSNSSNSSMSSDSQYASRSSSMHSLTPTQSIDQYHPVSPSASILSHNGAETPTQGEHAHHTLKPRRFSNLGLNLFRSSSRPSLRGQNRDREGTSVPPSSWGHGLERWTSATSHNSAKGSGLPVERTQSTQSYKGENVRAKGLSNLNPFHSTGKKSKRPSSAQSSLGSRENGMIATLHSGERKPVTKMLNGRVYGGKRRPASAGANPFANARDDDPEFVEWGYGGMGSVKSSSVGGSVWGKVQSSQGFAGAGGGDEDDGTGMAWVRRRKEQRERERKEQEEREKALKEKAEETNVDGANPPAMGDNATTTETSEETTATKTHAHTPSVGSTATVLPSSSSSASPAEPVSSSPVTSPASSPSGVPTPTLRSPVLHSAAASPTSTPCTPMSGDDHILTAVNVPVKHQHHAKGTSHLGHSASIDEKVNYRVSTSESSESSSEDEYEHDKDKDKDDGEYDEEEEEEEEEEDEDKRKTSVGAGVEKISRHKT